MGHFFKKPCLYFGSGEGEIKNMKPIYKVGLVKFGSVEKIRT